MDDSGVVGKPVHNLREHIKKLFQKTKNSSFGETGFDMEFNHIEKKTEKDLYFGDYKSALKLCNRTKNRYSNVLPLEKSRVVLKTIDGVEGSDYINASHIRVRDCSTNDTCDWGHYICTQGPMQNTFDDFWRMVWEQDSSIIVMLTKEVENLKVKCARYWPESDPQMYGKLRVTMLSSETVCEMVIRTFLVEETVIGTSRRVVQYQYQSWPDHGLPLNPSGFLELIRMVDRHKRTGFSFSGSGAIVGGSVGGSGSGVGFNTGSGPIVVHCSAGIGRSGTFCTVHNSISKYRADLLMNPTAPPVFNVLQTVIYMREQRPGMVQTKEQYMFCCLSIEEETAQISKKLGSNYPKRSSLNYSQ